MSVRMVLMASEQSKLPIMLEPWFSRSLLALDGFGVPGSSALELPQNILYV